MKILVTGAGGFLGSWLVDALLELGHEVRSLDNLIGGSLENINSNSRWYNADILDLGGLTRAAHDCEAIYHCAALAYEGLSVFSPSTVVQNIVTGSVNIGVAAARCGVTRVVNCSSMARYGPIETPYKESSEPKPADPYGLAKLTAEKQLDLLGEIHGFTVVHAVPHNIIGPRQRYDDPYRNVAAIMINLFLQGRQPFIYGDGSQVRCFSFVQDVLQVLVKLLDPKVQHGELFNVGPDENAITVYSLGQRIAQLMGRPYYPTFVPSRPCETKYATCSSDKIRDRFNYITGTTLEAGLQAMIEYISRRGAREFRYEHLPIEIQNDRTPKTWSQRLF